ncbi:MAG: OmpH family outer membrane protein, partial [Candidatus Omnitrophota bacterium]
AVMALGMIGVQASASAAEQKFGYVDLARVFDEYTKTKEFDKNLAAKGEVKTQERERMVAEVKKLRDEAELLSAKSKEDKQAVIDEKIKTLQEFDRTTRDELRKERDVMVKAILAEIEAVIQNFGKSQGYTLILSDRALVYKSEGGDLTNQVIKDLNDSYASKKK